jgi:hypothetical protein
MKHGWYSSLLNFAQVLTLSGEEAQWFFQTREAQFVFSKSMESQRFFWMCLGAAGAVREVSGGKAGREQ